MTSLMYIYSDIDWNLFWNSKLIERAFSISNSNEFQLLTIAASRINIRTARRIIDRSDMRLVDRESKGDNREMRINVKWTWFKKMAILRRVVNVEFNASLFWDTRDRCNSTIGDNISQSRTSMRAIHHRRTSGLMVPNTWWPINRLFLKLENMWLVEAIVARLYRAGAFFFRFKLMPFWRGTHSSSSSLSFPLFFFSRDPIFFFDTITDRIHLLPLSSPG